MQEGITVTTKFDIGATVKVKPGDRPAHLPEDENNTGQIKEIEIFYDGKKEPLVSYLVEFKDINSGEVDPDWNEIYEEDMLEAKI